MNFNLTSQPWIPAVRRDGTGNTVSLLEVFAAGSDLVDLALRPHERIATLRLLIAIAQAALLDQMRGPETDDEDEWEEAASALPAAAQAYLQKHQAAFELFGEGQRFLQLRTAKAESTAASKLFFQLASGNSPTLFDHSGGEDRVFTPAQLALGLLTFQNFSPLIGRGYTGRGPCVDRNALHAFRLGDSLQSTVLLNCLSTDAKVTFGRPVWEQMPQHPFKDKPTSNATTTYLGRLAPVTRAVWLNESGVDFILANGPEMAAFDTLQREPTTTSGLRDGKDPYLVSASLSKGVWRDLQAITAGAGANDSLDTERRPRVFERPLAGDAPVAVWTGGMITDYKAKIEDVVEARFQGDLAVPAVMFSQDGMAARRYFGGVQAAEAWNTGMRLAIGRYGDAMKFDDKHIAGLRDAGSSYFWHHAELQLKALFDLVKNPDLLKGKSSAEPYMDTEWHKALMSIAHEAFEAACPSDTGHHAMVAGQARESLSPFVPSAKKGSKKAAKKAAKKATT
jgi:CRISPR system Cascade subunit CasA